MPVKPRPDEASPRPARLARCPAGHLHARRAADALAAAPDSEILQILADLFKACSDPTRLRILSLLSRGELCVQHIARAVCMSQSAVSHQLALLRRERIVRARREGKAVHYSLADGHVSAILAVGLDHAAERLSS